MDAESGGLVSQLQYYAPGQLDYGTSARATPILTDDAIYLQGAMGHLHCIDSITGEIRWKKHLIDDLEGKLPTWGFAASPLLVDGRLIVQPGGPTSSIVALDAATGESVWSVAGKKAAYASPILLKIAAAKQIVAFDDDSLGGWSLSDGKRLWEFKSEVKGDFNVPTPVLMGNRLALVSENNAARIHDFDNSGMISVGPILESQLLAGDSHTPIAMGDWLIGVDGDLVVLDAKNSLNKLCTFSDKSLTRYCSLIADEDRVLVACGDGTIMVLKIDEDSVEEIGRFSVLNDGGELLSHPALVNGVLYVRGTTWIEAYQWK